MGAVIEVKYFNTFLLKKTNTSSGSNYPAWNGSSGIPESVGGYPQIDSVSGSGSNWIIEESRIRGGYNNTNVDYGVRAYLVEDEPNGFRRSNSLIYSGILNSRTGINDTNVFSVADSITKSADPANGSIQKLHAEDTNLIILQEAKASRALIDKDAIYTAEGETSISNVNTTIGTIQPYAGNFGISRDPGSFAVYGYRKYFTDRDRNAVLRLSMDGLTEISNYGMIDFFRDEFSNIDINNKPGVVVGGWDTYSKQYVVSLKTNIIYNDDYYKTLSYDESVRGFPSFYNYEPDQMFSVRGSFFSLNSGKIWKHYDPDSNRGSFYGDNSYANTKTSIEFVFNPKISVSKVFKTINYEGSNGWKIESFSTDNNDVSNGVYSYNEGSYEESGVTYRAGFDKKENKYHANLVNNSTSRSGEVLWGDSMTGVKGYFSTVKISTDSSTNPGDLKELFAVSSSYVESSY
jgi:hypothetical protein